jgi:very-short-patch-repair endonuclease
MPQFETIVKARYLRKEETKAEKILWRELRNSNISVKFRRQHPVDMFILDFYAPSIMLAIELDGSIHKEKDSKEYDIERTKYLESKGIKIVRFWNGEIENNLEIKLDRIREIIKELSSI